MKFAGVMAHGAKADGVTDDTAAIQSAINDGNVTFPSGTYLVSNQISIPSNRYIKLMPGAILIRKANTGQQCASTYTNANFFVNSDVVGGNENITIEGGVFDGNELNQDPIDYVAARQRGDTLYGSVGMRFKNVKHLRLSGLTLQNNPSVQIQIGMVTDFIVEDITVYYSSSTTVHKETLHCNGPATLGIIRDIRDNGGNDSIIALDANDDTFGLMCEGDISYILVENLTRTGLGINPYVGTGIMLLCSSYSVTDITIRGIRGPGFQAEGAVLFRAFEGPNTGKMDRIMVCDCDVSTPNWNDCFCYCDLNIGSLTFNNNRWHPGSGAADVTPSAQCFFQQGSGVIENLVFNNTQIIRHTTGDVAPFNFSGTVGSLLISNTLFCRDDGVGVGGALVDISHATVTLLSLNGVVCSNLGTLVNGTTGAGAPTISGVASYPVIS